MTDKATRVPTLLDRDKRGGEDAEVGFGVQENVHLCRVPFWLSQHGFTQMTRESYGDCEARFFRPGVGYRREFVEVKSEVLSPTPFWKEIFDFYRMDKAAPDAYERFALYAELSPEVHPILTALDRIRKSATFYADVAVLTDANYVEFRGVIEKKVSESELADASEIAAFIFHKVDLVENVPSASAGEALFIGELARYFPESSDLPQRLLAAVYSGLRDLLKAKGLNTPLSRREIEAVILARTDGKFAFRPLCLHTCGIQNAPHGPLALRWERFFGGADRSYPEPIDWDEHVTGQLIATREWALEHRSRGVVHLNGERRLSAAFAVGGVFSAVSGFVLHQTYRDGAVWRTDDHPTADTPAYTLVESALKIGNGIPGLIVTISILGEIAGEVETATPELGLAECALLHLHGPDPVVSAAQANRVANDVKERIREALRRCGDGTVHLFYKGPSHIAVFIAHRLNAVAEIRCYEWVATNQYVPTCSIPKG